MSLARQLARPEILALPPVDIAGAPIDGLIRLNANENPFPPLVAGDAAINRYPEPQPVDLRRRTAALYGVEAEELWVTRGSDDAIDLLIRAFCRPGQDKVAIIEPTFSAYAQFARIQGAKIISARLSDDFNFDEQRVLEAIGPERPKLLFLCAPNNPTGTDVARESVLCLAQALPRTLVVVDEAYGEFSDGPSLAGDIGSVPNLVVLRTLSKAYGLAGARIGCAISRADLVELLSRVSPPYPLPLPSIEAALSALRAERMAIHRQRVATILAERARLAAELAKVPEIISVAEGGNFLFLTVEDPALLARRLAEAAIAARFRPNAAPGGVRVSIGTREENDALLAIFGIEPPALAERRGLIVRETRETSISVSLNLDEARPRSCLTGIAFFDHMLDQFASHGGFSLVVGCRGDIEVDAHHSIEDVGIALGAALDQALGDKRGIGRFGFALPMDETEAQVLIDLSGRPYFRFEGSFGSERVGDLPTQMVAHFFRSLADSLGAAIHMKVEGDNDHHKIEACFKAFGRAFRTAIVREGQEIPSTKGRL
jgi:histidinol-phosphate aminotransferase/imidazoleglycerol-phosphate dehydratase/histidinol-phosphatase